MVSNPRLYFTPEELQCPCCKVDKMDEKFLSLLVDLKDRLKFPLPIQIAYRCPKNPSERFQKGQGPHTKGLGVRVGVSGVRAYKALREALSMGFMGVGVHKDYIRLDMMDRPEGPTVWPEE